MRKSCNRIKNHYNISHDKYELMKHSTLLITVIAALISCGDGGNINTETVKEVHAEYSKTFSQFRVKSSLNGNSLNLSIASDLPDNIKVSLSVSRSYWQKDNPSEYSLDYLSEQSTIGQWRSNRTISLDNEMWKAKLAAHQKELAPLGLGFEVDKILDSISIYAVVTLSNNPFPNFKEKGMGRHEISIYFPLDGNFENQIRYGNYESLEVGKTYSISTITPLMPELNPSDPIAAMNKIIELKPKSRIKILSVNSISNTPWYEVKAFHQNNKAIGSGWINSNALIGQELRIIM